MVVESGQARRGIEIFAKRRRADDRRQRRQDRQDRPQQAPRPLRGAPGRLRQHLHLRPPRPVAKTYPAPKNRKVSRRRSAASSTSPSATPSPPRRQRHAARAPRAPEAPRPVKKRLQAAAAPAAKADAAPAAATTTSSACSRTRSAPAARAAGGASSSPTAATSSPSPPPLSFKPRDFEPKPLQQGRPRDRRHVLGHLGRTATEAPHLSFEIRPAGARRPADRPEADPRRLEAARVDRDLPRQGQEPLLRRRRREPVGRPAAADEQGAAIQRARARHPRIQIYGCGLADVRPGQIDRRVLATLDSSPPTA